jgi:hypothetical protein
MPCVLFGEALPFEDMTQMPFAVGTNDLHAPAIGIGLLFHGTWDLIIKTRPPAAGFKFIGRAIQGLIALTTDIRTWEFIMFILTGKGTLRVFVQDDVLLSRIQRIVRHNTWNKVEI